MKSRTTRQSKDEQGFKERRAKPPPPKKDTKKPALPVAQPSAARALGKEVASNRGATAHRERDTHAAAVKRAHKLNELAGLLRKEINAAILTNASSPVETGEDLAAQLRHAFNEIDVNSDGELSLEELNGMLNER